MGLKEHYRPKADQILTKKDQNDHKSAKNGPKMNQENGQKVDRKWTKKVTKKGLKR